MNNNIDLTKLRNLLSSAPKWIKILVSVLAGALCALGLFLCVSCGSTAKALIRNNAEATTTTVTITTNNPSNIEVSPDVSLTKPQSK